MKTGILLVGHGAANNHGSGSLRRFQTLAEQRFHLPVRWAYTSELGRRRMAQARTKSDSVGKALARMSFDGYARVAVQSLHLVPGFEFETMLGEIAGFRASGCLVNYGLPLIQDEKDLDRATACLLGSLPTERRPGQPVVLMAHGSPSPAGQLYEKWAAKLAAVNQDFYLACLESPPYFEQILTGLRSRSCDCVWLLPLLSSLGKHSLDDLSGSGPKSWLSQMRAAGLSCRVELRGLIEHACFAAAWLDRLDKALDDLRRWVQD